jgi:hypothetical protein
VRERRAAYRTALPGPLYCDTSALLKLFLPEPGSDAFNEVVEGRDDVLVSDLAVTEIVSALAGDCVRARSVGMPWDACTVPSSGDSIAADTAASILQVKRIGERSTSS